jgi:hypothetical protein
MSEINYLKVFLTMKDDVTKNVERVTCERYKLVDSVSVDNVDILHVKKLY